MNIFSTMLQKQGLKCFWQIGIMKIILLWNFNIKNIWIKLSVTFMKKDFEK